jgi:hypothetical protein
LGGTGRKSARDVCVEEDLMTSATNHLGSRKTDAVYPGGICVRNPQVSVKDDNFFREVVEYTLKTIGHPLSFFQ